MTEESLKLTKQQLQLNQKLKHKKRRSAIEEASPVAIGIFIQLIGLLMTFGLFVPAIELYTGANSLPFWEIGACQGISTFLIATKAEQPSWWRIIHFVFPPMLGFSLELQNNLSIQPEWFLGIFVILLLVYWTTFKTRVPLYLSSQNSIEALDEILMDYLFKLSQQEEFQPRKSIRFLDLGSGTGRVVFALAKQYPQVEFTGIEYAPIPCFISKIKAFFLRCDNVQFTLGDFWKEDLSQYQMVYAYLSPAPMSKLWEKIVKEMQPNTLFISNSFEITESQPNEIIQIEDLHDSQLLIWRFDTK